MPNWTRNTLVISGENIELRPLVKLLEESKELARDGKIEMIRTILPMPSELEATVSPPPLELGDHEQTLKKIQARAVLEKKYGVSNWYDWQVRNWGVKWGDSNTVCEWLSVNIEDYDPEEVDDGEFSFARFTFKTPWCPPVEALRNMAKLYPGLTFHMVSTDSAHEMKWNIKAWGGTELVRAPMDYDPLWDEERC